MKNILTASERQKVAELRRRAQKAPSPVSSPAEMFVSRMVREAQEERDKRIERGIIALLAVLVGIVLTWLFLKDVTVPNALTGLFWLPRTF